MPSAETRRHMLERGIAFTEAVQATVRARAVAFQAFQKDHPSLLWADIEQDYDALIARLRRVRDHPGAPDA